MTTDPDSNALEYSAETAATPVQAPSPSGGTTALRPLPEDAIPIVPMRNLVLFPGMILPAGVGRERSIVAEPDFLQIDAVSARESNEIGSVGVQRVILRSARR